ncbi:MAG: flippase-like domain-containing protein [Candidatus Methanoperedens sp.]|nr:flippase-like domain-containing protein [Candidatus Methanoperedens sp.]MCE8424324.1 flippase-like domain-containing protein [Candidatus Methanoperedens sp.]MCE8427657.1 flippase-like domain-containing protein [Candidatus Methanoperedens sp.]
MKKNRFVLQVIAGLLIIVFILNKINLNELLLILRKTSPFYFIMACLSYFCMNLVLATRLRYLFEKIGYRIKFSQVFFSHMGGMIVGDITPGRGGYFLTPAILKKRAGTSMTDGMACIFAPQAIEFILKVAGAFAAIIFISYIPGIERKILVSAGIGSVILLVVGILMLILSWKTENLSSNFLSKIPFLRKFTENLLSFKEKSIDIKDSINIIILLYFIGWIFAAFHWYFLGTSLGIDIPYYVYFLLHPLLSILMFIPLTPAGIGLMEGGIIIVLSLFGVSPPSALAFSVLIRVSILMVDMIGLRYVLSSLRDIEL